MLIQPAQVSPDQAKAKDYLEASQKRFDKICNGKRKRTSELRIDILECLGSITTAALFTRGGRDVVVFSTFARKKIVRMSNEEFDKNVSALVSETLDHITALKIVNT